MTDVSPNGPVHLLKAVGKVYVALRGGVLTLTACGLRSPSRYTKDPSRVTCRTCKNTVYMADMRHEQESKEQP